MVKTAFGVSLKHDGPTGQTTGSLRRNGARRATRPRTRVAGVWPVGQDDGPPDFILHVLYILYFTINGSKQINNNNTVNR